MSGVRGPREHGMYKCVSTLDTHTRRTQRELRAKNSEFPPKMREIEIWPSTNGAIVHFLVLPGSLLSITEMTEYTYFSPLKPCSEFKYQIE